MMCSGSDFFYVRSKYGHVMGDDLNGTLDCGCDTAQYNSFRKYYRNHLNLEKEGTDLVAYTLKRAKEKGMEAFITYRVNDLHFNDTTTHCPIWYTDFWIQHPEYWQRVLYYRPSIEIQTAIYPHRSDRLSPHRTV